MKKNTALIVSIGILLLALVVLGSRLYVKRQKQAIVKQPSPTVAQQQNNNSQQGGPDVPGQGGAVEGGAGAGAGGNN